MPNSTSHRAIERVGQDVELTVYEKTGEDEHGENYSESPNTPTTVKARVDRGVANVERDARAASVDAQAEIFIRDDVPDVDLLKDEGGDGAARVKANGITYVVVLKDDQDNGIIRLFCRRKS